MVAIGQEPALHLEDGGQVAFQAAGDVLFAPEPGVGQDKRGAKARPERALEHVPEQVVFGVAFLAFPVNFFQMISWETGKPYRNAVW
jgi:hypothetical protein